MRRSLTLLPLSLLAITGCATQPTPAPAPAPPAAPPVAASEAPANPSLPRQRDFITALSVRDAAERVTTALFVQLSLGRGSNVDVEFGSPDSSIHVFPKNSDYFSAIGDLSTAAGDIIHIDCEWIADNKTRVTVQSDLPSNRFAVVERVARESLQGTLVP
jgi:hypothetical protein